jgi:dipeptidyl aminopeptidase/acylaminoacyl peptidase
MNSKPLLFALFLVPAASAPIRAELPPIVPREVLFGNPVKQLPQISPDGARLAYLAPDEKGVMNVWLRTLGKEDDALVTHDPHRGIDLYRWAADGRHLLYEQDSDGDENFHVYSADLQTKLVRDMTPFQGVRVQNLRTSPARPGEILAGLNLRKRDAFDMYRIDLETGAVGLDTENPGDVLSWTTDRNFVIRAATAFDPATGETIVRVRNDPSSPWRDLIRMPFEDSTMFGQVNGGSVLAGFSPDGSSLYVVDSTATETAGLVERDVSTGRVIRTIASHPRSDVAMDFLGNPDLLPLVMTNPADGRVEAIGFEEAEVEWKVVDPAVKDDLAKIAAIGRGFEEVISRDSADRHWIIGRFPDDGPNSFYLYDRSAKKAALLFEDQPKLSGYRLAQTRAFTIKSRDGLPLLCYLTLPPGVPEKNLPLVANPHGGPWWRDRDFFAADAQLLANRGYAVLAVEFRGSIGFGKKFLNAGTHQFGLAMEDDILDGVKWAVSKGIADPKRLAIYGASAGGYATLRAITEHPDMFRCAVDLVGPSDLKLLFSTMPAGWGAVKARWVRRMGDVEHDEALDRKLSPLFHADAIRSPILIGQGANDPRVNIENSNRIVAAARARGVEVTYVVYPDEGHGFARPENNIDFYGRMEEFLAKHLGGRAEPLKKVAGSTGEVR